MDNSASSSSASAINNSGAGGITAGLSPVAWIVLGVIALAAVAWWFKRGGAK